MVENGTAAPLVEVQAGGVDRRGNPIAAIFAEGERIGCLYEANQDTRLGTYEDGRVRMQAYRISLEGNRLADFGAVGGNTETTQRGRLVLRDAGGQGLGTFEWQRVQYVPRLGRTIVTI